MKELRELARSAHDLMVFEAAARNQSFTAAALELEVKPGKRGGQSAPFR